MLFPDTSRNSERAVLIDVAKKQGSKLAARLSIGSQIVERQGKIRTLLVHILRTANSKSR
jgi:hypothetical protein